MRQNPWEYYAPNVLVCESQRLWEYPEIYLNLELRFFVLFCFLAKMCKMETICLVQGPERILLNVTASGETPGGGLGSG